MIIWDAVRQFPTRRAGPNSKDRFLSQQRQEEATAHWIAIFSERDVWASEMLEWDELLDSEAFDELRMLQELEHAEVDELLTH